MPILKWCASLKFLNDPKLPFVQILVFGLILMDIVFVLMDILTDILMDILGDIAILMEILRDIDGHLMDISTLTDSNFC